MNFPSSKSNKKPITIEEGDFYMENGFMVFTAQYLKKRGYCCKNGCRHCPFGYKKVEKKF